MSSQISEYNQTEGAYCFPDFETDLTVVIHKNVDWMDIYGSGKVGFPKSMLKHMISFLTSVDGALNEQNSDIDR